jgi:Fe(3+) dicitrate transport protein
LSSADAQTGIVNGYTVFDFSSEIKIQTQYNIRFGVNNLTNERYATRRSGGYPGPGLLPGEARTWYLSVGIKI